MAVVGLQEMRRIQRKEELYCYFGRNVHIELSQFQTSFADQNRVLSMVHGDSDDSKEIC